MEYYSSKENVQEYIKMAEGHSGKELIKRLTKFISGGDKILELGSGPGTDWEILSKNYEVTGSDNSVEFVNYLNSKFPDGKFIELNAVTLDLKEKYDAVYSNKVLHHLTAEELKKSIQKQADVLSPGGVICHSFWYGEGDETFKGMYVNYHDEQVLEKMLRGVFKIELSIQYQEFDPNDSILIIARKT